MNLNKTTILYIRRVTDGVKWKSGSVYLTSKDKEVIDELIAMYVISINPDEEMEEGIRRIRAKIEN